MAKPNVKNLLSRFAQREATLLAREFLSAKRSGTDVSVSIDGIVCRMRVRPRNFEGFGIFKPISPNQARLVREATLTEQARFLSLLPRIKVIVQSRRGQHHGKSRQL